MSSGRSEYDDGRRAGAGSAHDGGTRGAAGPQEHERIVNHEQGKDNTMPPMSITGGAIMFAARPVGRRADYGVSTILDTIVTRRRPSMWRRVMRVFRKR